MSSQAAAQASASVPPGPPLLLTKRLVAFLHTSLTPSLTTAFLATPSGKLLAHASTDPSSTTAILRTRATVASLLWDIHASSSVAAAEATSEGTRKVKAQSSATPSSYQQASHFLDKETSVGEADCNTILGGDPEQGYHSSSNRSSNKRSSTSVARKPTTITVQLEHSVVVVRRLACGILFVASGPIDGPYGAVSMTQQQIQLPGQQQQPHNSASPSTSPSSQEMEGSGKNKPPPSLAVEASASLGNLSAPKILEPPLASSLQNPPVVPIGFHPTSDKDGMGVGVPQSSSNNRLGSGMEALPGPQHLAVGSPSDSIMSAGAASTASVGAQGAVLLRRHAEEVAQMLDSRLAGLKVPAERIGADFMQ